MSYRSKEELENMLEDVVNELNLSDAMIKKHGPLGTAPAELVRLVIQEKDLEIQRLKSGAIRLQNEGGGPPMTDKQREAFEKYHTIPENCHWNAPYGCYCWTSNPNTPHPLNELWETWVSACEWRNDQQPNTHQDDVAVDRFAEAMKTKLSKARSKGRMGWEDKSHCSAKRLAADLWFHLFRGNPGTFEDIANYAMMLHQRGEDPAEFTKNIEHFTQMYTNLYIQTQVK